MAQFQYRAMDANGKDVTGAIDADSADEAAAALQAKGLFPMRVTAAEPDARTTTEPYMGQLAGPPRSVPLGVRARVLFGGFVNQFGWLFFGFGMIFFWLFAMRADVASLWRFSGELATVQGVVSRVEKTDCTQNGVRVYAIHYAFEHGGRRFEGVSYGSRRNRRPGGHVTVEFPSGQPTVSRIQGMRRSVWSPVVLFVVIFPLVGLCFIVVGLRKGLRALHLLRHGVPGSGVLVSKDATNTRVNDRTVYKLTFEFQTDDGATHQAIARSHTPEVLEDEEQEPLLYDPSNPARAVMLDALPGAPRIDADGQIRTSGLFAGLASLVLPLATIVGHGLYVWSAYLN